MAGSSPAMTKSGRQIQHGQRDLAHGGKRRLDRCEHAGILRLDLSERTVGDAKRDLRRALAGQPRDELAPDIWGLFVARWRMRPGTADFTACTSFRGSPRNEVQALKGQTYAAHDSAKLLCAR